MQILRFFPEQALLERIKAGDRTVLGEIFTRYEKLIGSYVKSHGGNDADAEDMLQETIIVLWQKVCAGNFTLSSRLGTYLLGVIKNKWHAEIRKRERYVDGEFPEDSSDENPSSLDVMMSNERTHAIQKALDAINPICKELLLLYYFEERKMEDIARRMNFANADVAKSKKYQCKKSLEAALKQIMAENERTV